MVKFKNTNLSIWSMKYKSCIFRAMIIITLNYVLYLLGVVGLELFLSMSIGDDVAAFKKIKMLLVLSTCVMYGDAFS